MALRLLSLGVIRSSKRCGFSPHKISTRLLSTSTTANTARFPVLAMDGRLVLLREENSRSGLRSGVLMQANIGQTHLKAVALFPAHGCWVGGVLEGHLPDEKTLNDVDGGLTFEPIIAPKVVEAVDSTEDGADVEVGGEEGGEEKVDVKTETIDKWETLHTRGGKSTWGQTLDNLGRQLNDTNNTTTETEADNVPLEIFRLQPRDMEREIIKKSWHTGHVLVDTTLPIGHGQSMLVLGPDAQDRTHLLQSLVHGIARTDDVYCVYAPGPDQASTAQKLIEASGFTDRTTIVSTLNSMAVSESTSQDPCLDQYLQLFTACTIAEVQRDAGGAALLVIDNLNVMQAIWFRAVAMVVKAKPHLDAQSLMSGDRADLRLFYSALVQRAAKLLNGGSLTILITRDWDMPVQRLYNDSDDIAPIFALRDFELEAAKGTRPLSDITRLSTLETRGVVLDANVLKKLKIRAPNARTVEAGANGQQPRDVLGKDEQGKHCEELKSLCDGHMQLDPGLRERHGFEWVVDIRKSVTRIGVGRNRENSRDTRPKALQKVSKGLRLRVSSLVDNLEAQQEYGTFNESDESLARQSASLDAWKSALAQSPLSTLTLSEQVALLLPIMEGYVTPALVKEIHECGVTADLPFVKALLEAESDVHERMESTHDLNDEDMETLKRACCKLLNERYGGVGKAHIPL